MLKCDSDKGEDKERLQAVVIFADTYCRGLGGRVRYSTGECFERGEALAFAYSTSCCRRETIRRG